MFRAKLFAVFSSVVATGFNGTYATNPINLSFIEALPLKFPNWMANIELAQKKFY